MIDSSEGRTPLRTQAEIAAEKRKASENEVALRQLDRRIDAKPDSPLSMGEQQRAFERTKAEAFREHQDYIQHYL